MSWTSADSSGRFNGRHAGRGPTESAGSDSPEAIQQRMADLRHSMGVQAAHVSERAKHALDWKYYVERFPFACVGLAAVAGFVVVPSKQQVVRPSREQLEQLAKDGKLEMHPELRGSESRSRGATQAALATVGVAVSRALMAYVGKQVGDLVTGASQSNAASAREPRTARDG